MIALSLCLVALIVGAFLWLSAVSLAAELPRKIL